MFGEGYIDADGDHRWYEGEDQNWIKEEVKKD
jgi:hypothetical protein